MKQGLFITVEGGEGAGKTTLIEGLKHKLLDANIDVITTREPGGILIAEQIRSIILDKEHTMMDIRTEALLYAAARRQHLTEKVIPALNNGQVVICDRFIDSSLAYQGHARGLGMDVVLDVNRFAIEDTWPDWTILMDVSPETGLERIHQAASREINRLDLEGLQFHRKVHEGYELVMKQFPERIERIDASQSSAQILDQVFSLFTARFKGFFASNVKFI
ncbi:dTMP kinase [Paenibacillaceae bacterium]|nr:dTMP kinase [Paenibacillaceae bacterium]